MAVLTFAKVEFFLFYDMVNWSLIILNVKICLKFTAKDRFKTCNK